MGKYNIAFINGTNRSRAISALGVCTIFLVCYILSHKSIHLPSNRQFNISKHTLNPPALDGKLVNYLKENKFNLKDKLKCVSSYVQGQIRDLQNPEDCNGANILCGHYTMCGFGCQLHHRAACLMLSYAMGLPLIHETELPGLTWAYSSPWTEVLLPLGSRCNVTNSTYTWSWKHPKEFYSKQHKNSNFSWNLENARYPNKLSYPLFNGIVVSKEMGELIESIHSDPYKWWVSQFVKFAFRVQEDTLRKIESSQKSIGLESNCIGFHIRRTDKVAIEDKSYYHEINKYFEMAELYTKELNFDNYENYEKPQIFIASDDASVLKAAVETYNKSWNVIGFEASKTLTTEGERRDFLYEIIRDTLTLAKCDVIVCGLSSNICSLLQELQWGSEDPASKLLISLDKPISRYIMAGSLPGRVNKV